MTEVVPILSVEVTKLAAPPLNVPVPSTVVPFMNETVSPFGGAPAAELTTAVKVTASPEVDGFGEDVSVVVVISIGRGVTSNATALLPPPPGVVP